MYFSNIGLPFTGERQPLRPQRRPAPLTQGSQGAPVGIQRIFRILDALSQGNGNPSGRSGGQLLLHRGAKGAPARVQCFFEYRMPFHGGTATPQAAAAASSPYTGEPRGSCGGTAYFLNIGCSFTGERQPLRPQQRPAPLAQGSQGGSCEEHHIFRISGFFSGRTATPQAAAAASSPYAGEPGGSCEGQHIFRISGFLSRGNGNLSGRSGGQLPLHRGAKGLLRGAAYFSNIGLPFTGERQPPQAAAAASSPYTGEPRGIHAGDPVQKRVSGGEPLGTLFFALRQRLFGYCKNTSPHPRRR